MWAIAEVISRLPTRAIRSSSVKAPGDHPVVALFSGDASDAAPGTAFSAVAAACGTVGGAVGGAAERW